MINPKEQFTDTIRRHDKKIESLEVAVQGILLIVTLQCLIKNAKSSVILAKDVAQKCYDLLK